MKKLIQVSLFLAFFLLITSSAVNAKGFASINDSIHSKVLNEQRKIEIRLPEGYEENQDKKYDVIYIVDGEWNMELFSVVQKMTADENYMPRTILVAVPNTYIDGRNMRDRDFLPEKTDKNELAGGADNFIKFFKDELMPHINNSYRTSGNNSLWGHSHGGRFAMYALLKASELFDTFYCSDPSFWWNDGYMLKLASEMLDKVEKLDKTLWISGITETAKFMGVESMDSILKIKAPEGLYWGVATFPNETHNSVRLKGIYDGMKFAFQGYGSSGIAYHPQNGILLKDQPSSVFIFDNRDIRYTLDGSEPNEDSPKAVGAVNIDGNSQLVLKAMSKGKFKNKGTKVKYEIGETIPSIKKLKKAKKGGLKYSYYEGDWNMLPDFSKLTPKEKGVADSSFDISKLKRQSNFACLLEGYIKIEKDGYYVFVLDSDDGAKLYFNNKLIADNDGLHGHGNPKTYILPLEKGFYPIKTEYFQKGGGMVLNLSYVASGAANPMPLPIPTELLYSK